MRRLAFVAILAAGLATPAMAHVPEHCADEILESTATRRALNAELFALIPLVFDRAPYADLEAAVEVIAIAKEREAHALQRLTECIDSE